jgi:hypothetical protein
VFLDARVDRRYRHQRLVTGPPFTDSVFVWPDGHYVGFTRPAALGAPYLDAFVYARVSGLTGRASAAINSDANGNSYSVTFSGDDSLVAFASAATNLVANDTNAKVDIFTRSVRDIITAP